jgi:hypothetical protein
MLEKEKTNKIEEFNIISDDSKTLIIFDVEDNP